MKETIDNKTGAILFKKDPVDKLEEKVKDLEKRVKELEEIIVNLLMNK